MDSTDMKRSEQPGLQTPEKTAPDPVPRASGVKTTLLWVSGVAPTRLMFQEAKATLQVSGWAVRQIKEMLSFNREQAKSDIAAARQDPERFWDEMVVTSKITDRSLRQRYKIGYAMAYALFFAIAGSVGMTLANLGQPMYTAANVVLINLLLIHYITNQHRLYSAREQRLVTLPAFIRQMARQPILFMPTRLPDDFKLRTAIARAGGEQ